MDKIWAIILAAGASTRMKRQKLLLPYGDKTILEKVIETAVNSVGSNVIVVLGSHKDLILEKIGNSNVDICVNENYLDGMLSSVICGFNALPSSAKAALIFLGDQPQIPAGAAELVIVNWEKIDKGIIMPTFQGKRGHPVLIETKYISEIKKLDFGKGLRQLAQKFSQDVYEVECEFPEILRDIDTPDEYKTEISKIQ